MVNNKIIDKTGILDFFKEKEIIYLHRTRVNWKPLLKMDLKKSTYYKDNIDEFKELDSRYGSEIDNNHIAPVYIKKINDKIGFGLFANSQIKKDDYIGEYTGVVQIAEEKTEFYDNGSYETDFSWDFPDEVDSVELEINGRLEGNELRFVNHDINDNLNVEHTLHNGQWLIFFTAKRDIDKDEQLFVHYGDEYWSGGFRDLDFIDREEEESR